MSSPLIVATTMAAAKPVPSPYRPSRTSMTANPKTRYAPSAASPYLSICTEIV